MSIIPKAPAILIGLSLLVVAVFPVFANDSTSSAVKPIIRKEATTGGNTVKQIVQQRIEVKKENIEDRIASLKEKLASKTAALRLRLQEFKDKKKAEIAERINTNLNNINQNQTIKMQKHLDTMSGILNKLEARVNKGTPDIKDPVKAKIAILSAREAIASASAALEAQSQRDYTIQVTTESRIRFDAKKQRDLLHQDLTAVRKMVIDAKQAVANAIRVAKSGSFENREGTASGKEATSSGQQ